MGNARAQAIYRALGFGHEREVRLLKVTSRPATPV